MRICLVTREYPTLGSHGGIGTYTLNVASGLAARGHDVTVIARGEGPIAPFMDQGVHVEPVDTPDRWRLPAGNGYVGMTMRALPFAQAAATRFKALNARHAFDVVEVPEYQGWGVGVALAARCPVAVRLHTHTALVRRLNDVPMDLDARIIARLEHATICRGDVVLANSAALAGEARQDFGFSRIGVLPLGIDAERFAPHDPHWLRQELGLGPDTPIVLYVGRLERRKGVEALIEAFGQVRAAHPEAVLVMAGFSTDTGPNGQALLGVLRNRLEALGALDNVRFMGHVAYDALPRYYAGCDLFVAPSRYEPFGMIYLEAMACGKAVVGTSVGGVPEIIQHGRTGYLVPPDDPEALAQALRELLQYPSWRERMGEAAREHVHASFSLPVIAAATERQYLNAATQHQGRNAMSQVRRLA
ncbi:MAG: glycosyl transferase family 1 [Cyanobacteria bacterium RYN_339]|nr:glycosyl transferase family 1 [Cyanobacteria bacterium RYN_339]